MMKNTTPSTQNNQAIVDWFAEAGVTVEIVEHCADSACERCERPLDRAA